MNGSASPRIEGPVPMGSSFALYRECPGVGAWQEVEIVERHSCGQFVVREIGRPFPGVLLAFAYQLRVPGPTLQLRETA